jgi:maleamate amidohydrolase
METREENYRNVFNTRLGFGRRCAVVVIDFIKAYTTPGAAFYAEGVVEAVQESVGLLACARAAGVPVIYTKVLYDRSGKDGGLFVKKVPALRAMVEGEPLAEIDPKLEPASGDVVIAKNYPSGFFGTTLATTLWTQGVDTVVLIGCSTSGCVRATAVDAIQHGFRVVVPRECVGDRHAAPHDASLFDIHAKYGDVIARAEVEAHFERTRTTL